MGFDDWRRLVAKYLGPHRGLVIALAASLFASIALQIATPQVIRAFVDRATDPAPRGLATVTALYIAAVLVQQAIRVVTTWLSELVGWLTTNELRGDLFAHVLSLDPDFHKTHTPGELIERVDGDVTGLGHLFAGFLLNVVGNLLLLVGVLTVITIQSPFAGGVLGAFALAALSILAFIRRVSASSWQRAREETGLLFGFIEERLAGTQDIRSSGAEAYTLRGFYERARNRLWATSRARVMDAIPGSVNALIALAGQAAGFVVPALLVRRNEATVGEAFVLYFYTQVLLQPLHNVSRQVEQLQVALAGGRRVVQLLATRSTIVDASETTAPPLPAGALPVRLRRLSFGYGDDPDVLSDLTLDLPAGHVLGVVGRTGSGKSTLARLLVRLHDPREGAVEIGGVDIREVPRPALRQRIAFVTQEVHVLRASLRDNLTLFDATVPDAAVLDAIGTLGLRPWFEALPDGLDTILREGGAGLSAGESQLLSFGRAFLADPSLVILDEASSRLDPATEVVLESAVDALLAGRTGVVIAHRLATLDRCDTICVLDDGHIVEHGEREVLARDPDSRFGLLLRAGLDAVAG